MLQRNNFSGGFAGSAITVANSGGSSGTAWVFVSGSPTYSSSQATGTRAPLVASIPDSNTEFSTLQWDITLAARTLWLRAYLYLPAWPTSDSQLADIRTSGQLGNLTIRTDGKIELWGGNVGSLGIRATSSIALPTSQWVRVEAKFVYGTTGSNGAVELRIYTSADGATTADTQAATNVDTGTSVPTSISWHGLAGTAVLVDDLGVSDVDWLGPASISQTVTPGVVAASVAIPTPQISTGLTVTPGPITTSVAVPDPEVFTGSVTVPANPDIIPLTVSMPAPTVEAFKNVTIEPEPVLLAMSIPAPVTGVPVNPGDQITKPGQIEWNGFLIGAGTPYRMLTLDGWFEDLPDLDSGNVPQPNRHGAYSGRDLAQERHVILSGRIRTRREDMEQVVNDLIAEMTVGEDDTELPLAIRVLGTTYVGYGKAAQRRIPVDKNYRLGLAQMTLQWTLSDPVLLSRELHSAVIADGTTQQLANLGNTRSFPLIRVPGPATDPLIAVQHPTAGERVLEFAITLTAGQILLVDPYYGTVTLGGQDRLGTLTGSSVPPTDLVLPAGLSEVTYISDGGGAPAITVLWRHAYL